MNSITEIAETLSAHLTTPELLDPNTWLKQEHQYHPTAVENFCLRFKSVYDKFLQEGDTKLEVHYGVCGSKECHLGKKGFALVGNNTRRYTPLMIESKYDVHKIFHCSAIKLAPEVAISTENRLRLDFEDSLLYNPSEAQEFEKQELNRALFEVEQWKTTPVPFEVYQNWFKSYEHLYKPNSLPRFSFLLDKTKHEFHKIGKSIAFIIKVHSEYGEHQRFYEQWKDHRINMDEASIELAKKFESLDAPLDIKYFELPNDAPPIFDLRANGTVYPLYLDDAEPFFRSLGILQETFTQVQSILEKELEGKIPLETDLGINDLVSVYLKNKQ